MQNRNDRNKHGGGIMIYIKENIPCGELNSNILQKEIETISLEFSIGIWKWLCIKLF